MRNCATTRKEPSVTRLTSMILTIVGAGLVSYVLCKHFAYSQVLLTAIGIQLMIEARNLK